MSVFTAEISGNMRHSTSSQVYYNFCYYDIHQLNLSDTSFLLGQAIDWFVPLSSKEERYIDRISWI